MFVQANNNNDLKNVLRCFFYFFFSVEQRSVQERPLAVQLTVRHLHGQRAHPGRTGQTAQVPPRLDLQNYQVAGNSINISGDVVIVNLRKFSGC
jgi:hypothetical protein